MIQYVLELSVPNFVKNGGSFISWLENLKLTENMVFQLGPVQQLYNMAIDFGVRMYIHSPHGGEDLWAVTHIHFGAKGQIHVAVTQEAFEWLQKVLG